MTIGDFLDKHMLFTWVAMLLMAWVGGETAMRRKP